MEQINSLTNEELEFLLFVINDQNPIQNIVVKKDFIPSIKHDSIIAMLDKMKEFLEKTEKKNLPEYEEIKNTFDSMSNKLR